MKDRKFALGIIEHAFRDKTDLAGQPYIDHLKRVEKRVSNKNEDIKIIALLHDLLEDCPDWNEEVLRTFFYKEVVDAIVVLTKLKGEAYEDYIMRVSENRYATIVKVADLQDNMTLTRLTTIKDKDVKRLRKYLTAYHYLNQ